MKALILAIVAVAILLGLQQGHESRRLAAREKELRELGKTGNGAGQEQAPAIAAADSTAPAKVERQEHAKFDPEAYIGKCKAFIEVAMKGEPAMGEEDFIQSDLLDATAEELLQLPDKLREAGMMKEFRDLIYESVSTRLLDKDPLAACEFSMKGGEIQTFILVTRAWIARDPQAAAEWLEMKTHAEPPLNEMSFGTHLAHPEPIFVPGLQLAASIAAGPATADLEALTKLEGSKLKASLDDVLNVLPADGLPILMKRLAESGREDLVEMVVKLHPDQALAREYLEGVALPQATFTKMAEAALNGIQPGDLPRAMEWYLKVTDPELRGEGLQRIVSSWTNESPRSAAAWIEKLPEGQDRERAKRAHEEALAHPRPKKPR